MCDRIIGPYVCDNAEGFTEIVNGERYRHMLNAFLTPVIIHLRNRHELCFQQYGVSCHTANETTNLNAPNYYLWEYLKNESTSTGRRT